MRLAQGAANTDNAAEVLGRFGAKRYGRMAVTPRETTPSRDGRFSQAAAEEFRLLVESVKDYAIFLLDPDGYVMSWNAGAERIKGYGANEILVLRVVSCLTLRCLGRSGHGESSSATKE